MHDGPKARQGSGGLEAVQVAGGVGEGEGEAADHRPGRGAGPHRGR